ncbi:MAG: hypothetical protein ACOYNR_10665 [Blastocatellia bacterium]
MPTEGDAVVDVWRSTIELPISEATPEKKPGAENQTIPLEPPARYRLSSSISELPELEGGRASQGADDPLEGSLSAVIPITGPPFEETPRDTPTSPFSQPSLSSPWIAEGRERDVPVVGAALSGGGGAREDAAPAVDEEVGKRFRLSTRATGALLLSLVEGASARAAGARSRFAFLLLLVLGIFFLAYLAWR